MHKGVPTLEQSPSHVTIFARGYSRYRPFGYENHMGRIGGGLYCGIARIQANLIHEPCIVLDFPDEYHKLSLGQQTDRQLIAHAYNLIRKQYPQARITLMGECLGAFRMLSFATNLDKLQLDDVVDALVLESPILSAHDAIDMMARAHVKRYLGKYARPALHSFLNHVLRSYSAAEDNAIANSYECIRGKAIYIGHRKVDTLGDIEKHSSIAKLLGKKNQVYQFVTDDTTYTHARLHRLNEYRDAMNYFLQQSGNAHNSEHASRGTQLIKQHTASQHRIYMHNAPQGA